MVGTSIWTRLKSGTGTCAESPRDRRSPPRRRPSRRPPSPRRSSRAWIRRSSSRPRPPARGRSATSVKPRRSVSLPSCALGEDRAHAERATDFLADDDAAQRGRQHDRRLQMRATRSRERVAERVGELGILQHERTLQVPIAVQPGRQPEMPFEQRAGPAEQIENGLGSTTSPFRCVACAGCPRTVSGSACTRRPSSSLPSKPWFSTGYGATDQFSLRSSISRCTSRTRVLELHVGVHHAVADEQRALQPFGEVDRRALAIRLGVVLRHVEDVRRCSRGCSAPSRSPAAAPRRRRRRRAW